LKSKTKGHEKNRTLLWALEARQQWQHFQESARLCTADEGWGAGS